MATKTTGAGWTTEDVLSWVMLATLLCWCMMSGCAAEEPAQWFKMDMVTETQTYNRLAPLVRIADTRAMAHLRENGFEDPARGLEGYDRLLLEKGEGDNRELKVMYTKRVPEPQRDMGMGHFTVVVNEHDKRTVVLSGQ